MWRKISVFAAIQFVRADSYEVCRFVGEFVESAAAVMGCDPHAESIHIRSRDVIMSGSGGGGTHWSGWEICRFYIVGNGVFGLFV